MLCSSMLGPGPNGGSALFNNLFILIVSLIITFIAQSVQTVIQFFMLNLRFVVSVRMFGQLEDFLSSRHMWHWVVVFRLIVAVLSVLLKEKSSDILRVNYFLCFRANLWYLA